MAHNFFISYDLVGPGRDYDGVFTAITQTGDWARIEESLFYVSSEFPIANIFNHVWGAMDSNDVLVVINASANEYLSINVKDVAYQQLNDHWNR